MLQIPGRLFVGLLILAASIGAIWGYAIGWDDGAEFRYNNPLPAVKGER